MPEQTSLSAHLIHAPASDADPGLLASLAEKHTTALYTERGGEFLTYAVSISHDEELARDALQEAFMRYFVALCDGDDIRSPRAWVYRVLHNYVMDRMKEPLRHADEPLDPAARGSQDIEAECFRGEVMELMRTSLTAREYACVRLRTEGFGYEEIASELRVRSGTVGAMIARSLRKLRSAIGVPGGDSK